MHDDVELVIGASGLAGQSLVRTIRDRGQNVVGTYASRPRDGLRLLDFTNAGQISECFSALRPKTIYLAAALTHVDYCEEHPEEAQRRNLDGPKLIAQEAARLGAKLIFYSTEYVFDGKNGPYDEEARPEPLSVYGKIKLAAEEAIRDLCADALIIRTTVLYGWDTESVNFAMQIYSRVKSGAEMTIPIDQIGNP